MTRLPTATLAAPATGMISITGYDSHTSTSVAFSGPGSTPSRGQTEAFAALGACFECVTLFSVANNGLAALHDDAERKQLSTDGVGTFALTGFDDVTGDFQPSTQGGVSGGRHAHHRLLRHHGRPTRA